MQPRTPATSPARSGTSTEGSSSNERVSHISTASLPRRSVRALHGAAGRRARCWSGCMQAAATSAPLQHQPPALALRRRHRQPSLRQRIAEAVRAPRRGDEGHHPAGPPRGGLRQLRRLLPRAALDGRGHHRAAVPRLSGPHRQPVASGAVTRRSSTPPASMQAELCSTSAAFMALLLQAHAEGLGACWMAGPMVARDEIQAAAGHPRRRGGWSAPWPWAIPPTAPDEAAAQAPRQVVHVVRG